MAVVLAFALIVGLAVSAIRSPLVRRIGFRNAVRRPREAMLVMLGCVLGTALIVGSGSVADSFTASIRDQALNKLGAIDAHVTYESAEDWSASNARLNTTRVRDVRAAAAAETLEVPLTSNRSSNAAPRAKLVEVDYRRAAQLAPSKGVRAGSSPAPGTAWVSRALANRLALRPGSLLTLHSKVPGQRFRVTKIVNSALVTFVDSSLDSGQNLLVSPGTIAKIQQQDPAALVPRYLTLVEATGRHTKAPPHPAAVERLRATLTDLITPFNGSVAMVRADNLRTAKEVGTSSGQFLVTVGTFGIIAGIMLLINVLLMLAEERLAELGTMRAVGLPRQPLIASFALEGALYSLVGALLGGGAGLGIGRFMVMIAARATRASGRVTGGLPIHFEVQPATVAAGVAAGFVVATVVVLATSFRISRLQVIRALRNLPAPRRTRRQGTLFVVLGLVAGPLLALYGHRTSEPMSFMFGVPIFFACVGVLLARRRGYAAGVTLACGANVVWELIFVVLLKDPQPPPQVLVFAGVLMVASGVLFMNAQQARLAEFMRRFGRGRSVVTTRLGLANPIAHRVRMLLTVAPFALVVFTLVYAEGLSHLLQSETRKQGPTLGGAYQVFASSSPVNPYDFSKVHGAKVRAVARTSTIIGSFARTANTSQRFWPVSAFDRSINHVEPPRLLTRAARYPSDRAAYRAVLRNADLIIVPSNFLFSSNQRVGAAKDDPIVAPEIGQSYTMVDPATGAARDVTVAAVTYADVTGSGAFYGQHGATALFGPRLVKTSAFISTRSHSAALVRRLEHVGVANGVQADVISDASDKFFKYINDVVNLYRSDLGIGIVVGIAGIAVVLVRSVRDRRRQIGTLRAMGFDAGEIGWSFVVEGAFVAIQGLVVGVGLGFALIMALTQGAVIKQILGYNPGVSTPSLTTVLMAIGLFVVSILASAGPARSASRIPPAVALRLVD